MQEHKCPPDYFFVLYNIAALCLISLLLSKIKFNIPYYKIFKIWNVRGYTIYLYQCVIFYGMHVLYLKSIILIQNRIVQWLICACLVFIFSTLLSHITYPLEQYIMRKMGLVK